MSQHKTKNDVPRTVYYNFIRCSKIWLYIAKALHVVLPLHTCDKNCQNLIMIYGKLAPHQRYYIQNIHEVLKKNSDIHYQTKVVVF